MLLNHIALYFKERATFTTWLLLPVFILVMGHSRGELQLFYLYPLMWGVFFYNTFGDLLCFDYDQGVKKYTYLENSKTALLLPGVFFLLLYLSSLIFSFPTGTLLQNIALIIVCSLMYLFSKKSPFNQLIRYIKLPLLLYMIASQTQIKMIFWPLVVIVYFLMLRDWLKKSLKDKFVIFDVSFILGLFIAKLLTLNKPF